MLFLSVRLTRSAKENTGIHSALYVRKIRQPESTFTKQLDYEVECAKQNEKWRREYMKELLHDFDMKEEGRREGREDGIREGKQELNRLNQLLAEKNHMDDIIRAAQDTEYQRKLFEEFQIV